MLIYFNQDLEMQEVSNFGERKTSKQWYTTKRETRGTRDASGEPPACRVPLSLDACISPAVLSRRY